MKTIKIQILHELAINSAKNETYKKGVIDKAVDPKLVEAAYHEQAGNEAYHEALLQRSLLTQIEVLKTKIVPYLTGGGNIAEDATIDSTEQDGVTEILLSVSDRFNDGLVKSLARLSQKFVEDRMIHLWWVPVSDAFAKLYASVAQDDLNAALACFTKSAPTAPKYKYPTDIILKYPILPTNANNIPGIITPENQDNVPAELLYDNPWLMGVGQDTELSYTLTGEDDEAPIDDIVVRCDNPKCCHTFIDDKGRWNINGRCPGYALVTLFSRHNDKVFATFAVRITP